MCLLLCYNKVSDIMNDKIEELKKIYQVDTVEECIDKIVKGMNDTISFYSTMLNTYKRYNSYHDSINKCIKYIEEISKCNTWEELINVDYPKNLLR